MQAAPPLRSNGSRRHVGPARHSSPTAPLGAQPNPSGVRAVLRRRPLAGLVFLSGAASLVYEVLWLKELSLLFGSTAYAASTTLAVFFLGLAVGGAVFGRWSPRLRSPLRAYAWIELGIAASAALYFVLLEVYLQLYGPVYDALVDRPAAFNAFRITLATLVLLPPAALMGGTLPVLGQHLVRRPDELGRHGSRLYALNTIGAASGALLAGFVLPSRSASTGRTSWPWRSTWRSPASPGGGRTSTRAPRTIRTSRPTCPRMPSRGAKSLEAARGPRPPSARPAPRGRSPPRGSPR